MKKYIAITSILIAIVSCNKKNENLSFVVDSYPMDIGTEWTYDRQVVLISLDSIDYPGIDNIDTINTISKVQIEKDTVFDETMNVTVFKSQLTTASASTFYYFTDGNGLRTYAYSNAGNGEFPMKTVKYTHQNTDILTGVMLLTNGAIYYENPPTLNIKYPLKLNESWTYREPSESLGLEIDKEVVGAETLTIMGNSYDCYKVKYRYLYNPLFDGIDLTDWISKEGLIKRLTIIDSVSMTSLDGEYLYTAHYEESIILKNYIKP